MFDGQHNFDSGYGLEEAAREIKEEKAKVKVSASVIVYI
jgi:hypothetical protein